ncbi:TraX family protein [Nocardioides sp. HB32]
MKGPAGQLSNRRIFGYDAFRGLAMLAMLVDHLCLVFSGPYAVRMTVGRLAMPMFFLLAGHLARRVRWRHGGIFLIGCALPVLVPWIDSPNVLVWWAVGVLLLAAARWAEVPAWLLVVVALAASANGWVDTDGTYDARCLWGLMALGAMLPASAFTWAGRAPRWVAALGCWPITFYVGHLLLLEALIQAASW